MCEDCCPFFAVALLALSMGHTLLHGCLLRLLDFAVLKAAFHDAVRSEDQAPVQVLISFTPLCTSTDARPVPLTLRWSVFDLHC